MKNGPSALTVGAHRDSLSMGILVKRPYVRNVVDEQNTESNVYEAMLTSLKGSYIYSSS